MDPSELEKKYLHATDVVERLALDRNYISYLAALVLKNPRNATALTHLGMLCWEPLHEVERAMTHLQQAIACDPKNVEARFWLAKCYYHDYCDYKAARQLVEEGLQLEPTRADCLDLLASIVMDTTKDVREAIGYLQCAVQDQPDWPMLRLSLGALYLEIGDVASAEREAQVAMRLISNKTRKPRNGVEEYYEKVVTGRGNTRLSQSLDRFQDRILQIKKERI